MRYSPASSSRSAWGMPCGAARHWIGREPFAVLLPDELMIGSPTCTAQLVNAHDKTGGNVIAVIDVPREQARSYGIAAVRPEKDGLAELTGLIEKPKPEEAPSTLAWIGRCVLLPGGVRSSRQA